MRDFEAIGHGGESMRSRAWLVAIVITSVALAAIWLWFVPLLQNPDENAHADYAYALLDVGHPYRVERPTLRKDVTPQVRYAEGVSSFYGVRTIRRFRVPQGYGERSYLRAIDAGAPRVTHAVPPPGSAVPYVMFSYPAGYYAIVATIMASASALSNGSFVTAFFAARAFGLLDLVLTLLLGYRILRASRIDRNASLVALAAVGFFPMTSWVSGYIQPDDLVAVGVALVVVLCQSWRGKSLDVARSLVLGATIGSLALVKLHYAIVMLCVCVPFVASYADPRRVGARTIAGAIAAFATPALVGIVAASVATPVGKLGAPVSTSASAATHGGPAFVSTVLNLVGYGARGFVDAFVWGASFHRYWNSFGWLDYPYVSNGSVPFEAGLALLSIATLCIVGARQRRILARIVRIARRRSIARAFALLARDVVFNTYLFWSLALFAVYALSHGDVALQGRYWFPAFVPLLVVLLTRLPRPRRARERPRARISIAAAFCLYSLVSAPLALHAMFEKYYGAAQRSSRGPVVSIDGSGFLGDERAGEIVLHRSTGDSLTGYAFSSTDGTPLARARIVIDGRLAIPVTLGGTVASDAWRRPIGFVAKIEKNRLSIGRHALIFEELEGRDLRAGWNDATSFRVIE